MSEVQARPAASRGRRGAARGGRAGSSGRSGGRTSTRQDVEDAALETTTPTLLEDQGELGQLKKQYGTQLATLSELFPDWTEEDIVFALQETDGDLEGTVERITSGKRLSLLFRPSHQDIARLAFVVSPLTDSSP